MNNSKINPIWNKSTQRAQTSAKGAHILKISSKSVHKFWVIYLYKLHFMDPEDPHSDPDHSQNWIISFFYLFRHILKIALKSAHKFLSYLVHKQTHKLTNPGESITSLAEVKRMQEIVVKQMAPVKNIKSSTFNLLLHFSIGFIATKRVEG